MTDHEQKMEILKHTDRRGLASKKFRAFLLMELLLTTMAVLALYWQKELGWPLASFMTGIVFVMGFIAVSFNTTQAKLDLFVRGMAMGGQSKAFQEQFEKHLKTDG